MHDLSGELWGRWHALHEQCNATHLPLMCCGACCAHPTPGKPPCLCPPTSCRPLDTSRATSPSHTQWLPPCRTTPSRAFPTTGRHSCRLLRQVGGSGLGWMQLDRAAFYLHRHMPSVLRWHVSVGSIAGMPSAFLTCQQAVLLQPSALACAPAHNPWPALQNHVRRVEHLVHVQERRLRNHVGNEHGDPHGLGENRRPICLVSRTCCTR